jgi:hypothetical protein
MSSVRALIGAMGAAYSVHRVHPFSPLVSFLLYPMAIEICEETIDVICTSCVLVPLTSIIVQKRFVLERVGLLDKIMLISGEARSKYNFTHISKTFEMCDEVANEIVIQAHQVCAGCRGFSIQTT